MATSIEINYFDGTNYNVLYPRTGGLKREQVAITMTGDASNPIYFNTVNTGSPLFSTLYTSQIGAGFVYGIMLQSPVVENNQILMWYVESTGIGGGKGYYHDYLQFVSVAFTTNGQNNAIWIVDYRTNYIYIKGEQEQASSTVIYKGAYEPFYRNGIKWFLNLYYPN